MKTVDLDDILDEDPSIASQQFAVISYVLPEEGRNELDRTLFKFRGAFRTIDECKKRAKNLKNMTENEYIMLHYIEAGKWGRLKTNDEILTDETIDLDYENEMMNDMMKGQREQKEKVNTEHEERKKYRKKQLEFDGTKEGQKYLNSLKESIVSITDRLDKQKNDLQFEVENSVYVEKRLKYFEDLKIKLQNLIREETSTSSETVEALKVSEQLRKQTMSETDAEIKELLEQKDFIEKRIKELEVTKNNVENFSIEKQISVNDEQIKFAYENREAMKERVQKLRDTIKETQLLAEKTEAEDREKQKKDLNQQSIYHAAQEYSKIKLGSPDDYESSFTK